MSREEALQSGHGSGANEILGRNLKKGVVRTIQKKLPPWVPGSMSARSARSDRLENPPDDDISKEAALDSRHIIADVLPHQSVDPNPITYEDINAIMDWAIHPEVAGHIYQLESGPPELYKNRWGAYLEYYRGIKDDEGRDIINSRASTAFFKAVNKEGKMIAVSTIRWKEVPFVRRGRTAYWERLIVDPDLLGKRIGTAFGIEILDNAFYKADAYDGQPATEVRVTTYVDRIAQGFDRNELFLRRFGFEKDGDPMDIRGRRVQPWKLYVAKYEQHRPTALKFLSEYQPKRREYLKKNRPSSGNSN